MTLWGRYLCALFCPCWSTEGRGITGLCSSGCQMTSCRFCCHKDKKCRSVCRQARARQQSMPMPPQIITSNQDTVPHKPTPKDLHYFHHEHSGLILYFIVFTTVFDELSHGGLSSVSWPACLSFGLALGRICLFTVNTEDSIEVHPEAGWPFSKKAKKANFKHKRLQQIRKTSAENSCFGCNVFRQGRNTNF